MARCYHCSNECVLPFTCLHCGGKFYPDCRLPPPTMTAPVLAAGMQNHGLQSA
ncbi:MAG: hypothetical protein WCB46_06965 [Methanoregula sp.]